MGLINRKAEQAVKAVVEQSTDWFVLAGIDNAFVTSSQFPRVCIVAERNEPLEPHAKCAIRKVAIEVTTIALKADTEPETFESGSNVILDRLLGTGGITNDLSNSSLLVCDVIDESGDTRTLSDGYIHTQRLSIVCQEL